MSALYLDTSAALKLIFDETESAAFADFYRRHSQTQWVSSSLLKIELTRGVMRIAPHLCDQAASLLEAFSYVRIDHIVQGAMNEPDRQLRSLDAIHIATARLLGSELDAFVSYDQRQLLAASSAGLMTLSPR